MVSKEDQELFLRAIEDSGESKDEIISLEDLLGNFSLDYGSAQLDDRVIRIAVWNLSTHSPFSEDYQQFLFNVTPERSANYLVGSLADPERVDIATRILQGYSPSRETVNPLVGSLANPEVVDAATRILQGYGQKALQFIRPPIPGTKLYEPLKKVITQIKQVA